MSNNIILHNSLHQEQASTNPLCCLLCSLRKEFTNERKLNSENILKILEQFSLTDLDEKYIHFDPHQYARVLVAVNKHFSLILNCWSPNQKTPLHNHGSDVSTWVHILDGNFFIYFEKGDKIELSTNSSFQITQNMGNHTSGNASSNNKCLSLHLYSPPYLECCFKANHGPGCKCSNEKLKQYIPLIHCNDRQHYYKADEELETMALLKSRPIFSNFRQLVEILRKEIVIEPYGIHSPSNIKHIKDILSCMKFNPKEWEQYAKFSEDRYTRNLIAYDEKFTILLLCWDKGLKSPIHDHSGSNCWVKVLEGDLEETVYTLEDGITPVLKSQRICPPGSIAYINDSYGVHRMGNANNDRVTISLHIYSPAYHECFIFDEDKPCKKKVSISTAYGSIYPFMERKINNDPCCSDLTPHSMKNFICSLHKVFTSCNVEPSEIDKVVNDLVYSELQWENYIHFSPDQYTRNLLGFTDHYSAVLVCWCPGQQTPIHEHGESTNRRVWIKALTGQLKIQLFEETFNQLVPSTKPEIVVDEGQFVMLLDKDLGQHRTFNASNTNNCISLHIYSPPYVECSFVEQTGNKKLIPVAYCSKDSHHRAQEQEEDLELQCKYRSIVFSDFATFSNLINKYFEQSNISINANNNNDISTMLSHISFNPQEWRNRFSNNNCKNYNRTLVAYGYNYSIHLICWKEDQSNVVHDHNTSYSYFKVLEGSLTETIFEKPDESEKEMKQIKSHKLIEGNVIAHKPEIIHQISNQDSQTAYTLHVYSPPLRYCCGFCISTGKKTIYECNHHLFEAK